jgi:hypothetical protein
MSLLVNFGTKDENLKILILCSTWSKADDTYSANALKSITVTP